MPSQHHDPGVDSETAYHSWYRANVALAQYSTNQWVIFCVGFPIAITVGMILTRMAGWLEHLRIERMLGIVLTYVAPAFGLSVSAFGLPLAILGVLIAASCLGLSLKIITSKWSRDHFLRFLVTGFTCIVLVVILDPLLKSEPGYTGAIFVILLETAWGTTFGMWVASPAALGMSDAGVDSHLQATPKF